MLYVLKVLIHLSKMANYIVQTVADENVMQTLSISSKGPPGPAGPPVSMFSMNSTR